MSRSCSGNTLRVLAVAGVLAGAQLLVGGVRSAGAQPACYQQSPYLMDNCGNPAAGQGDYEYNYANGGYYAFADGTDYLVFCKPNDLTIYNLANPMAPTSLAGAHIPWDWRSIDMGGDTHGPYKSHLFNIATAGGFRYGLVSMGEFGWDFLRISGGTRGFLGTGYHPAHVLSSNEYVSTAVYTQGSVTYAVGQKLDQQSIASNDTSIKIYQIGNATDLTPGLGVATIQPLATVPTGPSFATPMLTVKLSVINFNGRKLLFAWRRGLNPGMAIADITDPANPVVVYTNTTDSQLVSGANPVVDEGHSMVWVASSTRAIVYGYQIQGGGETGGAIGLANQSSLVWWGTGTDLVGNTILSVAGNLLVASAGIHVGYLSLAGGQPVLLPGAGTSFTDISLLAPPVCSNPNFGRSADALCAFQVAGQHYVLRSMEVSADIVAVNSSCISTTPLPDFRVTPSNPGLNCGAGSVARGFPGDTFTITDQSAGVWTQATLDIKNSSGAEAPGWSGPVTITTYGQSVQWTPPASAAPGNFNVTLAIAGGQPPSTTKVISLCGDPQAVLTVTVAGTACANPSSCTALVNDLVTLGDSGTQGWPSTQPTYLYQLGAGPINQGSSFTPGSAGNYTVGVVVPYAFQGTPDTTCTNPLFAGLTGGGTYFSCAIGMVHAGYGTASFQVEQPAGTKVADATAPGNVNVGQSITLKFTGRVASGYSPSFQWSVPNLNNSVLTCSYTGAPFTGSTCTIPGNTLPAAAQQQWNLRVNVCSQGGQGSPPANCTGTGDPVTQADAPAVSVTPVLNSIDFSATPTNPNIGQTVTITLGTMVPATGYSSLTIDYGGMSCDGVQQASVLCTNPFGQYGCSAGTQIKTFSYSSSGAKNIRITGYINGGTVQSSQFPVTVSASGSCPCPAVTAVNVSGSSTAAINQSVSFSAQAQPTGHTYSYSWTFGDGGTANGASVSHAWSSAGTYRVQVTARNECGATAIGNATIVIGGGGGGNLTITPSPATVDPGSAVTFTFAPGVSQSGDSVTFNFGDGTPTQTLNYLAGLCSPAAPCATVLHSYSSAGTYTVTASGRASGTSVSGSTQVTVQNNCQLPSAPVASFTFSPTQVLIGQVVQFTDTSTGTPTSWSWNFGGPGVTSSIPAATASLTTLSGLTISPNPTNPTTGQQVIFTVSPALTLSGDRLSFDFGDGTQGSMSYNPSLCGSGCAQIAHTYSGAGTFTVSASGTAAGASVSGSTSVTVTGTSLFSITPNPSTALIGQTVTFTFSPAPSQTGDAVTINFGDGSAPQAVSFPGCQSSGGCNAVTHAYSTANNFTVTGSGTAGGNPVSGAATVVVSTGGGGGGGTSTTENPVYTYTAAGQYTVTLTATNCKGSSTTQQQITVLASCPQSAVPTANFTWAPTGAYPNYPQQQQPFVGQTVTLTDASSNEPTSWHWNFGDGATADATSASVTHTWSQPGTYTVVETATNCVGSSEPASIAVTVAENILPVTPDFSWSPLNPATGTPVTFTAAQGPAYGNPTAFTWTFDDGSTQNGTPVTYTFTCGGSRTVTLTASRESSAGTVSKVVPVNGPTCGPEAVMAVDAAKVQGLNGTDWHADLRVYNPSSSPTSVTLQFLPVGQDNSDPFTLGPYKPALPPHGTLVLNDILQWLQDNSGQDFSKTALRVTYQNDDDVAPVVLMNTYNRLTDGSRYGQINSGVNVVPGGTSTPLWLSGLHNNGLTDGFRTNFSIVNQQGDPSGVNGITFTMYDSTGAFKASKTFNLAPFGYIQDSIKNLFGGFDTVGTFSLKIAVPVGKQIQAYASVMDNHTGDPVMIPAIAPPNSPIYLPAIGHLNGLGGTVWRADLQMTNPDSFAHTWEVKYTPKASDGLPTVALSVPLPPDSSAYADDVVATLYGSLLPDNAQTSGIIRIAPTDGSGVYPIVSARAYNVAPNGTYGQGIPPLWAAKGISAGGGRKLVLAGMSSEDIARTNVGFVNLSDTRTVNFAVSFYDEEGALLNPKNGDGIAQPLTISVPPGQWDQDKLENRFHNAFKVSLPSNRRAISAEITVTSGGPGFAYATVIDSKTGDPNFIAAQPVP